MEGLKQLFENNKEIFTALIVIYVLGFVCKIIKVIIDEKRK